MQVPSGKRIRNSRGVLFKIFEGHCTNLCSDAIWLAPGKVQLLRIKQADKESESWNYDLSSLLAGQTEGSALAALAHGIDNAVLPSFR